jgi:hypothetical protein
MVEKNILRLFSLLPNQRFNNITYTQYTPTTWASVPCFIKTLLFSLLIDKLKHTTDRESNSLCNSLCNSFVFTELTVNVKKGSLESQTIKVYAWVEFITEKYGSLKCVFFFWTTTVIEYTGTNILEAQANGQKKKNHKSFRKGEISTWFQFYSIFL